MLELFLDILDIILVILFVLNALAIDILLDCGEVQPTRPVPIVSTWLELEAMLSQALWEALFSEG